MKHMTLVECPRERDVLDAIAAARWPDRVDRELCDHVNSCAICRDVVAVATVMSDDEAWREAVIPSSGQAWWRAEMRARQEAIRNASRPFAVAQGLAATSILLLGVMAAWSGWPSVRVYMQSFAISPDAPLGSSLAVPLFIALVVLAVIAPIAFYLVIAED